MVALLSMKRITSILMGGQQHVLLIQNNSEKQNTWKKKYPFVSPASIIMADFLIHVPEALVTHNSLL